MANDQIPDGLPPIPSSCGARAVRAGPLVKVLFEIAGEELALLGGHAEARESPGEPWWRGVVAGHLPSNCRSRPSTMTMKSWYVRASTRRPAASSA